MAQTALWRKQTPSDPDIDALVNALVTKLNTVTNKGANCNENPTKWRCGGGCKDDFDDLVPDLSLPRNPQCLTLNESSSLQRSNGDCDCPMDDLAHDLAQTA